MKKNKNSIIFNLFCGFFILFFSYATYVCLNKLLISSFFFPKILSALGIIILLTLIFYILISKLKLTNRQTIIILLLLIIAGVGLRIWSVNYFQTSQLSDFANPEKLYKYIEKNGQFSVHDRTIDYHSLQNNFSLFPTWANYSYLVLNIYNIFGYHPNIVKIMNIILFVLTNVFIFVGTKNMFSKKIALLTCLMFSISPTLILYTNVATPDFFTILFMSLIILFWSLSIKNKTIIKKKYIYMFLTIVSMACVNLFKPLSIYMLLVIIVSEFILEISGNYKNIKSYFKQNYKFLLFILISFFTLNFSFAKITNVYVENNIKLSIKNSSSMYLLWGYSVDKNIKYSSNYVYDRVMPDLNEKYNNDYDLILKELSVVAKDNFKKNIKYIPNIWNDKFVILFEFEDYYYWANTSKNKEKIYDESFNTYTVISAAYAGIMYISIIILALILIFKKNKDKTMTKNGIIILLMIAGYLAILILGGVQSRYKCLISIQFAIISAISLNQLVSIIANFNSKHFSIKKTKKEIILNVGYNNNSSL